MSNQGYQPTEPIKSAPPKTPRVSKIYLEKERQERCEKYIQKILDFETESYDFIFDLHSRIKNKLEWDHYDQAEQLARIYESLVAAHHSIFGGMTK